MRLSDYDKMDMAKVKELKYILDEIFGKSDDNEEDDDFFDYEDDSFDDEDDLTPRRDEINKYIDRVTKDYGENTIKFVVEYGDILMKDPHVFAKVFDILIQSAIAKGFCRDIAGTKIDRTLHWCEGNDRCSSKDMERGNDKRCGTYVSDKTCPHSARVDRSGTDYRAKITC